MKNLLLLCTLFWAVNVSAQTAAGDSIATENLNEIVISIPTSATATRLTLSRPTTSINGAIHVSPPAPPIPPTAIARSIKASTDRFSISAYYLFDRIFDKTNVADYFVMSNEKKAFEYIKKHIVDNWNMLKRTPQSRKSELGKIVLDKIYKQLLADIELYSNRWIVKKPKSPRYVRSASGRTLNCRDARAIRPKNIGWFSVGYMDARSVCPYNRDEKNVSCNSLGLLILICMNF